MTNRQWLMEQMQNMDNSDLCAVLQGGVKMIVPIEKIDVTRGQCICNWLQMEHKEPIKLSDAERVVLENVDKYFELKWICRDKDGTVYLFVVKPEKAGETWKKGGLGMSMSLFSHLFQFIKWEDTEPYNIEELLKGK